MVRHDGKSKAIVDGRPRKPVKVDEMWGKWEVPGVIPFSKEKRPAVLQP